MNPVEPVDNGKKSHLCHANETKQEREREGTLPDNDAKEAQRRGENLYNNQTHKESRVLRQTTEKTRAKKKHAEKESAIG